MLIASRPTSSHSRPGYACRRSPRRSILAARPRPSFVHECNDCLPPGNKEGGGAPKGASSHCPRRAIRCCHLNALGRGAPTQLSPARGGGRGGGSPHGAPQRRLPKRPNASAQPRPRFTRRRGRRRYPRRRSRLSGAPRASVVVPEGTMPEPPGVCGSQANSYNLSLYIKYMTDSFGWLIGAGKYIGIISKRSS